MAAADNSSVINLSVGGTTVYDRGDVLSVAVNDVSANGVLVAVSNGNDGEVGAFTVTSPAIANDVFGVGSFTSKYGGLRGKFQIGTGPQFLGSLGQSSPPFNSSFILSTIVANDLNAGNDDGLLSISPACLGKPCLIRWGPQQGSATRCNNAYAAGATACILYDYQDGPITSVSGSSFIPTAFISLRDGNSILAALKLNKRPVFKLVATDTLFPSPFSSKGFNLDLFIKPNVGSIGGRVYSTISPVAAASGSGYGTGPYGLYSGTSMAAPSLAGSLVLMVEYLKSKNRATSFSSVQTMLYNSAQPSTDFGSGLVDSVISQGAGLHNVYNALTYKTRVTPAQLCMSRAVFSHILALNDTVHTLKKYNITVTNLNSVKQKYQVSSKGAAMVSPYSTGDDGVQLMANEGFSAKYAKLTFRYSQCIGQNV
jgi:minor extracellular serine protease Vpr